MVYVTTFEAQTIASNDWKFNADELEGMWKEPTEAVYRHLSGETDENHRNLSQNNRSPDLDLNRDLPNTKQES